MDIFIANKANRPTRLDRKGRAWSLPVQGAPAFYRARNWPYKGRRTRVKTYPTYPGGPQAEINFVPLSPMDEKMLDLKTYATTK